LKSLFRLNEIIETKIVEMVSSSIFIVSVRGKLLRVTNSSHLNLRADDEIRLRVQSLDPVKLSTDLKGAHRQLNRTV